MFNNFKLCELIPHSGKMCLIDSIDKWDDESIVCITNTHLKSDNPLLSKGALPVSALIEYGAQAMAIHGALIADKSGEKMQEGYLAALKDVKFFNNLDISAISTSLVVEATRKFASQGNMVYEFLILSDDKSLISGRATVVAVFND
ncbi:3-hydroxydecanoyl-[ACP] dehydratase [Bathymodiolus heckerae thiotrophic gill symbiont]|uniref:3-hydroxylacyl-ACP dehydratase n=1 Tax=Bathymodiolus heckerae thiotrophic gill symbiont TaxID=1052212 RepID=UPI0010B21D1B|nr:3-hydroxylacyl-ACP dehydratase [Bathymodiolus heckerae thiotrophic gill symbiont]SHN91682.1 3-hydroxydecanoyl-[ACP] dehydratase [Bathymodiolus heckerae thiotrophic gill symbiont]